jgi:uncharacterized protein (DUF427 family)
LTGARRQEPQLEITIQHPETPGHFAILRPMNCRVVIRLPNGAKLAETSRAMRMLESGKSLYDPMVYVPVGDITVALSEQSNTTRCSLKGTASYFTYQDGEDIHQDLARSYRDLDHHFRDLVDLVAFYPSRVIIEEHPHGSATVTADSNH